MSASSSVACGMPFSTCSLWWALCHSPQLGARIGTGWGDEKQIALFFSMQELQFCGQTLCPWEQVMTCASTLISNHLITEFRCLRKFIFDNGGSLRELAVWPSDVGDFGYQMHLGFMKLWTAVLDMQWTCHPKAGDGRWCYWKANTSSLNQVNGHQVVSTQPSFPTGDAWASPLCFLELACHLLWGSWPGSSCRGWWKWRQLPPVMRRRGVKMPCIPIVPKWVLSRSFPPSPAMCCPLLLLFGVKFGTVLLKQFQEPRIYSDRLELFNFVEVVLCASRLPL